VTEAPDAAGEVSKEHRDRRRAAFERGAEAHRRAAQVHDDAARFFDAHGKPDQAARHRASAEVERRRAAEDQARADDQ
jgi:hypothetical protein